MSRDERGRQRGQLSPRLWVPAAAVLVVAIVALSLALLLGGDDGHAIEEPASCVIGTPGCELRQPVHWHADFALYIRGERFDFSDEQFLSGGSDDHHLSENVHIHEPRFNIVHIHLEQTTWHEFFNTLGIGLSDRCLTLPEEEPLCNSETERLSFFLNGVQIDDITFADITDIDRVLISFGSESEAELAQQLASVTDDACIVSGLCLDRVPEGGIEEEACTGSGTCT